MSAMAVIAALVGADALVRPDPAAPDRYRAYRCPSHGAFVVLSLDGWHFDSLTCRQAVGAKATCGARSESIAGTQAGLAGLPVLAVVARKGREVEWIRRRPGR